MRRASISAAVFLSDVRAEGDAELGFARRSSSCRRDGRASLRHLDGLRR